MTDDHHVLLKEYIERVIAEKDGQNRERFEHQTLRFDGLMRERDKLFEQRMAALDIRLEGMNAVRQQLTRQEGVFLTKDRYESQHQALIDRIGNLENWRSGLEGKTSRSNLISIVAVVVAIVSAVASAAIHYLK